MRLVENSISKADLKKIAEGGFGDMVKAVVDVERGTMAIGAELHADAEAYLLERGSQQPQLWGINLYPDKDLPDLVEFDSMINIRPSQGNRSRNVEDQAVRDRILAVVTRLVV
ncbi:MAG: hypothetical protein HYZ09_02125 [Candidatus Kerfeldbacteria bacterium]|nr:hypothetical protein [Candidatus Kerfeldbacteria bacterium]